MKLGFIGAGNMGSAIIKGILSQGCIAPHDIYISRKRPALSAEFAAQGVQITGSNIELAKAVDCVVIAVKPIYVQQVLDEVYDYLKDKLVISIVAGWTHDMLCSALPDCTRFVRVMPNTPLAVGEGMSLISSRYTCTESEFAFTKQIFECAGKVAVVEDHVFSPAMGISGCGPAFVYQFIEALADGGVACGLPRQKAQEYAAQTLLGAAEMVLKSGMHPGALKDAVCSPAGSTIQGVRALEAGGFRGDIFEAVAAAYEKTKELGKK